MKKIILIILFGQKLMCELTSHLFPHSNLAFPFMLMFPLKIFPPYGSMLLKLDGNNFDFLVLWHLFIFEDSLNYLEPFYELVWLELPFKIWNVYFDIVVADYRSPRLMITG